MIVLAPEAAADAARMATEVGGLPGAIIGTLTGVVVILATVIVWMQRRADKVYGYRLQERDTLKDSLHEAAEAINAQATATRERNVIMDELAQTIRESAVATQLLVERLTVQHSHLMQDQDRTGQVITSIAEAMRNAALTTSGVKQSVDLLTAGLPGITSEVKGHITRLLEDVQRETHRKAR